MAAALFGLAATEKVLDLLLAAPLAVMMGMLTSIGGGIARCPGGKSFTVDVSGDIRHANLAGVHPVCCVAQYLPIGLGRWLDRFDFHLRSEVFGHLPASSNASDFLYKARIIHL
ncbi:hypothetical protein D3C84_1033560 [compost metagenome]